MTVASDVVTTTAPVSQREPALIIGAVIGVLQVVLSILGGTTDLVSGSTAIAGVVLGVVVPLVQAAVTRSKVYAPASVQGDAL